jgi:hypothetical protein
MVSDNKIKSLAAAAARSGRRTQITIETHTTTVIRTTEGSVGLAYCEACEREVAALPLVHAAAIFDTEVSELELFHESGDLHATASGGLCSLSLAAHFRRDISFTDDRIQE